MPVEKAKAAAAPPSSGKHPRPCRLGPEIAEHLYQAGVRHIFGVPGDFGLALCDVIIDSKIKYIGTCNELNAAYAADAYARLRGIGCCVTTYAVGELSALNGIAGSWAEGIPVVKIAGCPPTQHWKNSTLLHHTLGNYDIPLKIYSNITCAQALISEPSSAIKSVDEVLNAVLEKKKPGYIGMCSDMVYAECDPPAEFEAKPPRESDPETLHEAVLEIISKMNESQRPIIIPGSELKQRKLAEPVKKFIETVRVPYTTMMLGKTVLDESHPQHIGLYCGDRSRPYVRERVEGADCVIVIGEKLTDFNTGGFTASLPTKNTVFINFDHTKIGHHIYQEVYMHDVISQLTELAVPKKEMELIKTAAESCTHRKSQAFVAEPNKKLTMKRLFDRMSSFIPENAIVIADTGASLFNASEVLMPRNATFIGQTFYGSIGYSIGATLGACIACPDRPVVLFVGDGSLQVTVQDISTMIRYKCNAVIFVINNDGYTIERVIKDNVYNDIQMWHYSELGKVFGGKSGKKCQTETELEQALKETSFSGGVQIIEVILDRWDCNENLRRAGASMAKVNRLEPPKDDVSGSPAKAARKSVD